MTHNIYTPIFKSSLCVYKLYEWINDIKLYPSLLKNIETIYEWEWKYVQVEHSSILQRLKRSKDFKQFITNINVALNTMHQTGKMMDYIQDKTDLSKKDLDRLSNLDSKIISKWKKDLISMGI